MSEKTCNPQWLVSFRHACGGMIIGIIAGHGVDAWASRPWWIDYFQAVLAVVLIQVMVEWVVQVRQRRTTPHP